MNRNRIRYLLIALLAGLFSFIYVACQLPVKTENPAIARLKRTPSAESCGTCHTSILKEWDQTLHAKAWVDRLYQMSFQGKKPYLECRACHSMEPILAGEISVAYEWRPEYRPYNQEDGVNCVSCHLRADGSVAARTTNPEAPCRPVKDMRITTPEFCGACHNPSHSAYYEWKESHYARAGVDCNSCHTDKILRIGADGKKKMGVSHKWKGGFDPAFVIQKSIRTWTRIEQQTLVMTVLNISGHKFPGEVPTRTFVIHIQTFDEDHKELPDTYLNFSRPYKVTIGKPDNRLLPDEKRVLRHKLPAEARTVKVSYLFKPSIMTPDTHWYPLDRWEGNVGE